MRKEVLSFLNSIYGDNLKFKGHKCSSGETRCYAPLGDLNLKHILANVRGAGYGLYVRYTCVRPPEDGEGGEYIEDSEEVSNMMCYGMGVHPSIIGSAPGKGKSINGTEARELFIIEQALMKMYQDTTLEPLYFAKAMNNWPKDIYFSVTNCQLTTLDQGTGATKNTGLTPETE